MLTFMPSLHKIAEVSEHTYFCPWDFAVMQMFSLEHVCTANFSTTLKMVMVGGYTRRQVTSSAKHFAGRVQAACLHFWDAPLALDKVTLNNVLFRNKVPGHNIEVNGLADLAQRQGWSYRYEPAQINKLVLGPFQYTLPSLTCVIVPAGGVNITGAKSVAELQVMQEFLEQVLGVFLRPIQGFDPVSYRRERDLAEKNQVQMALRRRRKRI